MIDGCPGNWCTRCITTKEGGGKEASDGQPYDDHDELNAERIHGDPTILVQVPEMAVILFAGNPGMNFS